ATAGGVATIQDDRIVPANLSEKLKKVSIYNFLVDGTDRLWMGSNEGVFIWDGDKLINYNQTHGLIGNDVNRNALLMEGDGRIWIGTEMGASVYDISTDLIARIKPIVHFEEIVSQKGTIIEGESNSLEYDDNTVEFDFLGISFFDEKQITYRYQLEGFDADWLYIDNPNAHSIRYTNLPPAEYRFNVQAGIGSTQWSDTISQDFEILQPFYSKTWFVILSIICSLIILYFIYRIRFFVILKKQKKLRRLVKMRTQEIEEKNEKLMLQSEQIFTINEKLEDTVNERTHQLQEQNSILVEYAFINSHELRGPICRILGLLELIGKTNDEEKEKIIAMIRTTGIELDEVSRSINSMLDNVDMGNLEYYKNIEQGNPSAQKTERGDNLESDND
ncbi:MAG: triple tyrosine motif-containing protein, partial [Bacteroidota bacterium]